MIYDLYVDKINHKSKIIQNSLSMKIKEWAEEDRPREKMLLKGIASLSDAELLAILIGSGNSRETAVQLSQRILDFHRLDLTD